MPLNEKDFILMEYTVKIKDTGKVIDTTDEKIAKEHGIYDEEKEYGPILVIIGEGRFVKGFEDALKESNVGEEKEVEIPPEKAFGTRDPSKIKTFSVRELRKKGVKKLEPGGVIEIGGIPGIVRSIGGGRAIIDFNHPLAGKTLIYRFKIIKRIDNRIEKIKHLVKRRVRGVSLDEINVREDDGKIIIELPEKVLLAEDIQLAKRIIANEIPRYIDNVKEIIFIDKFYKAPEEESNEKERKTQSTQ